MACSLEDMAVMVFIDRARAVATAGVEEKVVLVRLATPSSSRVTCVGKMSLHGCYC